MKDEGDGPLPGFILLPSSFILPEEPLTLTLSPEYRGEGTVSYPFSPTSAIASGFTSDTISL